MRKGPGTCPSCGADIIWIKAEMFRRALPVNPEPVRVIPSPQGYSYLLANGCVVFGFPEDESDREAEDAEDLECAESAEYPTDAEDMKYPADMEYTHNPSEPKTRPKMVEAYVSHYYVSPECGRFRRPRDRTRRMRKK